MIIRPLDVLIVIMKGSMDKYLQEALKRRLLSNEPKEHAISIRREPSKNEQDATYQPPNYGIMFCPHNKAYIEVCSACKRDAKMASKHLSHFLKVS
jgi:hypothetical protein